MKSFLISVLFFFTAFRAGAVSLTEFQKDLNSIAALAGPAVVSVEVVKEEYARVIEPEFFFGYMMPSERIYRYESAGIGSGFLVHEDGYVVTNYHVVEGAEKIIVKLTRGGEEKSYPAKMAGGDSNIDIAVLKITSSEKFNFLKFSSDKQKVGDFVVALGYPFGFKQTFTTGVISSVGISLKIEGRKYASLIQTDAAINQGNSGGPLLNINGEVSGVNTAIYSPSGTFAGMSFAIPAWKVRKVVERVIYGKKNKDAWLGVYLLPTDRIMRSRFYADIPRGGIINKVVDGSPAKEAGLKRGDIVISLDGEEVENDEDLVSKIHFKEPGETASIVYLRSGVRREAKITLSARPSDEDSAGLVSGKSRSGEERKKNEPGIYHWKGISLRYSSGGALVEKVSVNSPFAGHLKPGDLIKAADNIILDSAEKMKETLESRDIEEGILFDLERNGEDIYVSVIVKG